MNSEIPQDTYKLQMLFVSTLGWQCARYYQVCELILLPAPQPHTSRTLHPLHGPWAGEPSVFLQLLVPFQLTCPFFRPGTHGWPFQRLEWCLGFLAGSEYPHTASSFFFRAAECYCESAWVCSTVLVSDPQMSRSCCCWPVVLVRSHRSWYPPRLMHSTALLTSNIFCHFAMDIEDVLI